METTRLKLEPLAIHHLPEYFELVRDPEVMRFIRKTSNTLDEARTALERYTTYTALNPGFGAFAITKKDTHEFIGVGVLIHMELKVECGKVEVGYQFHKKEWGKGYAQEVTHLLIKYGFEQLNLREIYGTTQAGHVVSQAVLMKCGLQPIGRLEVHGGSDGFLIKRQTSEV